MPHATNCICSSCRPRRHLHDLLPALIIHAILFACLLLGAGCNQDQRANTIRASIVAVDAARDGFVSWDRDHQMAIVDSATSRADGEAKLAAYRDQRQKVTDGFRLVYRALALAATQTDDPSLRAALDEAAKLLLVITTLRGG